MHAGSTPLLARDTLLDNEESTARVPVYALSMARSLVGLGEVIFAPRRSLSFDVVPAPPRRLASAESTTEREGDSIAEDESTARVPDYVRHLAESFAEGQSVPAQNAASERALGNAFEIAPQWRSGAIAVAQRARLESAPSLEVFETYEEESSAQGPEAEECQEEDASEAVRESVIPGLERRSNLVPWIASSLIAAASIAMSAFTVLGSNVHADTRSPRVLHSIGAYACIGDIPVRPLAAAESRGLAPKREAVATSSRTATRYSSSLATRRVARASSMVLDNSIVRDLPF
jgi:hypothetical protein